MEQCKHRIKIDTSENYGNPFAYANLDKAWAWCKNKPSHQCPNKHCNVWLCDEDHYHFCDSPKGEGLGFEGPYWDIDVTGYSYGAGGRSDPWA